MVSHPRRPESSNKMLLNHKADINYNGNISNNIKLKKEILSKIWFERLT